VPDMHASTRHRSRLERRACCGVYGRGEGMQHLQRIGRQDDCGTRGVQAPLGAASRPHSALHQLWGTDVTEDACHGADQTLPSGEQAAATCRGFWR
jgi:hypothetical protein